MKQLQGGLFYLKEKLISLPAIGQSLSIQAALIGGFPKST